MGDNNPNPDRVPPPLWRLWLLIESFLSQIQLAWVCSCPNPRYIFFKFPIEMHNQFPTQSEKLTLFYQLLRSESNKCSIAILPNGNVVHCPVSLVQPALPITDPFSSVSWCLPLIATAVFQTAIITLGAKSQKVQARELSILSLFLDAGLPSREPGAAAWGWNVRRTPVDFPLPSSLCNLHLSNHLYLHSPHQAIKSLKIYVWYSQLYHQAQWQETHSTRQHC